MIMHRDVDDIIASLTKNRSLLARLGLALRVMFSVPKADKSTWDVGLPGL
jgi:hypothetical protein